MIKPSIALCLSLAAPLTVCLADDQQTETLHNNAYQVGSIPSNCSGTQCQVNFPQTQHINTVITSINCYFQVSPGSQIEAAQLGSDNTSLVVSLPVSFLGTDGSSSAALVINAQVNYFISKGDAPFVYVGLYGGAISQLQCLISGYHS